MIDTVIALAVLFVVIGLVFGALAFALTLARVAAVSDRIAQSLFGPAPKDDSR